jgi:hypothetical protein
VRSASAAAPAERLLRVQRKLPAASWGPGPRAVTARLEGLGTEGGWHDSSTEGIARVQAALDDDEQSESPPTMVTGCSRPKKPMRSSECHQPDPTPDSPHEAARSFRISADFTLVVPGHAPASTSASLTQLWTVCADPIPGFEATDSTAADSAACSDLTSSTKLTARSRSSIG